MRFLLVGTADHGQQIVATHDDHSSRVRSIKRDIRQTRKSGAAIRHCRH